MSKENRRHIFIVAVICIWTFQDFQVVCYPAHEIGKTGQSYKIVNENRTPILRQENEADDEPSDRPRLDDFIKGLNSVLTSLLTLDFRNTVAGAFNFIPPRVREGVENVVLAVIGKPQATTTGSSILFPEINGTTRGYFGANLNEIEVDEERED